MTNDVIHVGHVVLIAGYDEDGRLVFDVAPAQLGLLA